MSRTYIARDLRERVGAQARFRCGYCLSAQAIVGAPMEIDHIIPEALGGLTEESNLWLACSLCNDYKSDRLSTVDPESGEIARLFNPRFDVWNEHFCWTAGGVIISGQSPVGRATVSPLQLNRSVLVAARKMWVSVGWHPPRD